MDNLPIFATIFSKKSKNRNQKLFFDVQVNDQIKSLGTLSEFQFIGNLILTTYSLKKLQNTSNGKKKKLEEK